MFSNFKQIISIAFFIVLIIASIGFALFITGIIWYGALNIWSFIF